MLCFQLDTNIVFKDFLAHNQNTYSINLVIMRGLAIGKKEIYLSKILKNYYYPIITCESELHLHLRIGCS